MVGGGIERIVRVSWFAYKGAIDSISINSVVRERVYDDAIGKRLRTKIHHAVQVSPGAGGTFSATALYLERTSKTHSICRHSLTPGVGRSRPLPQTFFPTYHIHFHRALTR